MEAHRKQIPDFGFIYLKYYKIKIIASIISNSLRKKSVLWHITRNVRVLK